MAGRKVPEARRRDLFRFLSYRSGTEVGVICLSCQTPTSGRLCNGCTRRFRPAPERLLPGGIRLVAPFEHEATAQRLMHLLKYRGVTDFAELAAELLSSRVPTLPLVPIPRALTRRLKYGVDPALVIARAMGRRLGVPVANVLVPHIHSPRRAGRDHARPVPAFRAWRRPPSEVIVVDDVVTTGATMAAALAALGPERVRLAVAANSVSDVSSLSSPVTGPGRNG